MDNISSGGDDPYSVDSTRHNVFFQNSDVESGSIRVQEMAIVHRQAMVSVPVPLKSFRNSYLTHNSPPKGLSSSTHDTSQRHLRDGDGISHDYNDKISMNHVNSMNLPPQYSFEIFTARNTDGNMQDRISTLNVSTDDSAGTDDTLIESPVQSPTKNRVKSIRFAATNEVRTYTPNPEEFIDDPSEFFEHTLGCGVRARQFFATSALPFTYGATSSLTTIYFLYELMCRYQIKSEIIGAYLVGVYLCRIFFSSLSRFSPKTFVLVGSIFSLLGFGAIWFSQSHQVIGPDKDTKESGMGLILFIVGSIFSNCNETIGATQMFVREQNIHSIKSTASSLKMQFLLVKFARILSFVGAGFLYHIYGVRGVAILGAGMVSLQILCLIAYLALDLFRVTHDPNNIFGDDFVDHSPKCRLNCSLRAARGRRRLFKAAMSKLNRSLFKYYPPNIPPSRLRYIIPLCILGRTMSSVCIWNASTIILVQDFGAGFVLVGGMFACATAMDLFTSLVALLNRTKMPTQLELFICMGGILLSSAATAVPNLYAYMAGFFTYSIFNSHLRVLLMDLQGRSNNAAESITFQLVRRFWTAAALYSIPLLHAVRPWLPFALGFCVVLATLVMLAMSLIFCKTSTAVQQLDNEVERRNAREMSKKNRPSSKQERNLSFAERAMLARLIKGKDV